MKLVPALVVAGTFSVLAAPFASAAEPGSGDLNVANDFCGASTYQRLVGKPKSDIPTAPQGAIWRIYSTQQVVTMNFVEGRMDIVWDAESKVVRSVSCG